MSILSTTVSYSVLLFYFICEMSSCKFNGKIFKGNYSLSRKLLKVILKVIMVVLDYVIVYTIESATSRESI